MFDLVSYIESIGVDYKPSGTNIMKNHIGINCMFCGDDPTYHLNVKVDGTHALCFRCGKRLFGPYAILKIFEGDITRYRYAEIIQEYPFDGEVDERNYDDSDGEIITRRRIFRTVWNDFKSFTFNSKKERKFLKYLKGRHIRKDTIKSLDIRWADNGIYKNRVIIPIRHHDDGEVVNFVARSIFKQVEPKYRNCPNDICVYTAGKVLFGLYESGDLIKNKNMLVVCEGVFDSIRLIQEGVPSVAILKKVIADGQMEILSGLDRGIKVILMLDSEVDETDRDKIAISLSELFHTVINAKLSEGDPAEMSVDDIKALLLKLKKWR